MSNESPAAIRDHLANERTFLAYVRTALAFIGFGFVIARFTLFMRAFPSLEHHATNTPSVSTTLGVFMVCVGIGVGLFGAYRYERQRTAIMTNQSVELTGKSAFIVAGVIALSGAFVAYSLFGL